MCLEIFAIIDLLGFQCGAIHQMYERMSHVSLFAVAAASFIMKLTKQRT